MGNKKSKDASKILYDRYVKGDPEAEAMMDEVEAEGQIALQIYNLRKAAGLTQGELAGMVNTTTSVISRLEDADYEGHSMAMLRRIAKALHKKVLIQFVDEEDKVAA